jgi:septum formation protein
MDEMQKYRLILASASPRRLALLRRAGFSPDVLPARVDESMRQEEAPDRYVLRLAEAKCVAIAGTERHAAPPCLVIAADTAVVLEDLVLGKPADTVEAERMLRLLSGKTHEVMTGVSLALTDSGRSTGGVVISRVRFRAYDDRTISRYVATGEPLDKAGAYAIQGGGRFLAEEVDGSWTNVVGLPMDSLPTWIESLGLELDQLL